jgi:phosphoenolpyruvate phosphomutase
LEISSNLKEIHGEFIGLWRVTKKGAELVKNTLEVLSQREDFKQLTVSDLLNEINRKHPVAVKFIKGSWLDIDTIVDLQRADGFK